MADTAECQRQAAGAETPPTSSYYAGSVAGAAAVGLAQGISRGLATSRLRRDLEDACMRTRGYGKLTLSNDEEAELRLAKSDADKSAWADNFMKRDIAARVAEALKPRVPPLPAYDPGDQLDQPTIVEPKISGVGGVNTALLQSITSPSGEYSKNNDPANILINGRSPTNKNISLTPPAAVVEEFTLNLHPGLIRAAPGTLFTSKYNNAPFSQRLGYSGLWCGQGYEDGIFGRSNIKLCIYSTFDGYVIENIDMAATFQTDDGIVRIAYSRF